MTQEVSDLRQIRIDKLNELMAAGKNPYVIDKYPRDSFAKDILENFEEYEGKQVAIAGRLMLKRNMGKTSFINVMDSTGDIQVYVRQDQVGEEPFADFLSFDRGDIVGVSGVVFRTKKGERSVKACEIVLLAKCLQTLPEKYHGLKDMDLRYRQRYVDLIINSEIKDTFFKRNTILKGIRRFMDDLGYLEVETPILQTVAGGAAARPFLTYHNALNLEMQLRIANELFLKRLIVGGFDKVYEMGKMFRNEGISIKHNPEYTMIELYAAHHNYEDMMELLETLVETLVRELYGGTVVTYQGREIDVKVPWRRISMNDLVVERTGVDFFRFESLDEARKVARSLELEAEDYMTAGHLVNLAFEEFCEDDLIQPTFVLHHPVEISPLAKRNPDDERITNRFEAFINGWEIANAFSELNDPIDQRERFIAQVEMKEQGESETHPMDEDFLTAIEVGMPPTGGMGIGVDRLVMLLTDAPSIRDVIFFPTMRPIEK